MKYILKRGSDFPLGRPIKHNQWSTLNSLLWEVISMFSCSSEIFVVILFEALFNLLKFFNYLFFLQMVPWRLTKHLTNFSFAADKRGADHFNFRLQNKFLRGVTIFPLGRPKKILHPSTLNSHMCDAILCVAYVCIPHETHHRGQRGERGCF